jgi:hypothetical protein
MSLHERIASFMETGNGDFGALALALHAWQRENNADLRAFVGDIPAPESWWQIPAVPVSLFRDLALTSFDPSDAKVEFRTSGTTAERRGIVRLRDTALYDLGARLHAERSVGPLPTHGMFLHPDRGESSLAHMCRHFVQDATWLVDESGFDRSNAGRALRTVRAPVFVAGPAFAFHDLLEVDPGPYLLPPGSLVMVTGGYKGRVRGVAEGALIPAATGAFPGARVVGEYGMTELSSQLWATPLGGRFLAPPWLGVQAVDPWTGEPTTEGILRFFDLANVDTVLAIETADLGHVYPSGEIELLGRLPGAEPRGCSLTIEELSS